VTAIRLSAKPFWVHGDVRAYARQAQTRAIAATVQTVHLDEGQGLGEPPRRYVPNYVRNSTPELSGVLVWPIDGGDE
jgi:hypothetical protein